MLVDKQHVETGASRFTVYCIQNLISQRSTSSGQLQRLVGKLRELTMGKMHWLEEEANLLQDSLSLFKSNFWFSV